MTEDVLSVPLNPFTLRLYMQIAVSSLSTQARANKNYSKMKINRKWTKTGKDTGRAHIYGGQIRTSIPKANKPKPPMQTNQMK